MPKAKSDFTNFIDARPNYFPGQFLLEDDFEIEQKYFIDRQKYHRQSLHVSGIIEGLEVVVMKDKQEVVIRSGSGINSNGDLIILKKDTFFSQFTTLTVGELYISYREEKQLKQQEDFTRWQEVPTIGFAATTPNDGVKLAKISIVNNVPTLDLTVRSYSGIFLPNATGNDLTLRSGGNANPNVAILDGSLTVTGNFTVSSKLAVSGDQKIEFSDTDLTNNLKLQLWTGYGLGVNDGTLFYAANGKHSWRDTNGANERMVLTLGDNGFLTVNGTGTSSFAGNLRVTGTITGKIDAVNINSGVLDAARIANNSLSSDKIISLSADKITSGTIQGSLTITTNNTEQGSLTINTGGGNGNWNKLVINTTTNWGDKDAQYVTIGAGGGAGIMLHNPCVSWQSGNEKRASIRYGRAEGKSTGSFWDVGIRESGAFSFALNGITDHKMTISPAGDLTVSGSLSLGGLSFDTVGKQKINLWKESYGIGIQGNTQYFRTGKNFAWYKGGSHAESELDSGGGTAQMVIKDGNVGIGTANPSEKLEVSGNLKVTGSLTAGGSDIYFTQTDHTHTGFGNTTGFAAIENCSTFGALMILGRQTSKGRCVKLWDYLEINGTLMSKMEVIETNQRSDWNAVDHPIKVYFKDKLAGKPVGTWIRAIQNHNSWRGHYWDGWVDAGGAIRVTHNYYNTGATTANNSGN